MPSFPYNLYCLTDKPQVPSAARASAPAARCGALRRPRRTQFVECNCLLKLSPCRLEAQDISFSRRKRGFKFPRGFLVPLRYAPCAVCRVPCTFGTFGTFGGALKRADHTTQLRCRAPRAEGPYI